MEQQILIFLAQIGESRDTLRPRSDDVNRWAEVVVKELQLLVVWRWADDVIRQPKLWSEAKRKQVKVEQAGEGERERERKS